MTTEEKLERVSDTLDRLTIVVDALAATATARNNQLDALHKIVEESSASGTHPSTQYRDNER